MASMFGTARRRLMRRLGIFDKGPSKFPLPAGLAVSSPSRYLSIATVIKNEGPYLAEWLVFHRLLGVEHVYFYDNESVDETPNVLAPFIEQGFVTRIPWPGSWQRGHLQRGAFAHALATYGHDWHWMALIDVDEFLFPLSSDSLPTVLCAYEALPAIAVPWTMFGTSGHVTKPAGLVIESYVMREPGYSRPKSIVQPRHVRGVSKSHMPDLRQGRRLAYNERGVLVDRAGPFFSEVFRLNHYYTRSLEELNSKRASQVANGQTTATLGSGRQRPMQQYMMIAFFGLPRLSRTPCCILQRSRQLMRLLSRQRRLRPTPFDGPQIAPPPRVGFLMQTDAAFSYGVLCDRCNLCDRCKMYRFKWDKVEP